MSKRSASPVDRHGKHRQVECPRCGKSFRSDKLPRHLATHNDKIPCRYCKKDIREDKLPRHEILCKDQVDETHCNRTAGVHQHIDEDLDCSSVSGYFNTYTLSVHGSSDYDDVVTQTCVAAEEKLLAYLSRHPIKAQIIITLIF